MFTLVNYKYSDLFLKDSVKKELHIYSDDMVELEDGTEMPLININNTELHQEQFELTESLCSESELVFGSCEASVLKFTVSNVFLPMKDKWLNVEMVLDGNTDAPFQIGRYKVFSDVPTADRTKREIIAYDAMYGILNSDLAEWYNTILPNEDSEVTMKQFRTSLIGYFGIQQENIDLINDDMIIKKTIMITPNKDSESENGYTNVIGETMSGKEVISSICEINGCFGHIGRDGKFHYIYIQQDIQGLYPSDFLYPDHVPEQWNYLSQAETGHLYPQSPKSIQIGKNFYISCSYEDFVVRTINKLQIRQKENDIGDIIGNGNNCYVIEDNFLVYGKSLQDLDEIGSNIYNKINGVIYRPFEADIKGNPCLEVGDAIRIPSRYELIESYVLKRTLKGIQALRDNISADGEEYRTEKVNSIRREIIQLKGKSNTLTRTLNETRSELSSFEKDTSKNFTDVRSSIVQTAENIKQEVSATYETKTDARTTREEFSSKIEQTSKSIENEVAARTKEGEEIKATLSLKIDKNDDGTIVSLINGSADRIHFNANNFFTIDSPNFKINENGNAEFSGNITGSVITGSSFISELGKYKTKISGGVLETTLIHLIPPSGGGFVPGIARTDEEYKNIVNGIYLYEEEVAVEKNMYVAHGKGGGIGDRPYCAILSGGRIYSQGSVCPDSDGEHPLGLSDYRWSSVHAKNGEILTSDKNKKHDINPISEKYEKMFFETNPVTYMFNDGDRVHIGLISQDVEKSMGELGIEPEEFAAFCKDIKKKTIKKGNEYIEIPDLDNNGNPMYDYSFRYSEYIMLNTHMIQKLYGLVEMQDKKIKEQQAKIDSLKEFASFLMEKIDKLEGKLYEQDI